MNTQQRSEAKSMEKKTTLLLVVHRRPDWDALVGVFLWLVIHKITQLHEENLAVFFDFVPAGTRVSKEALTRFRPDLVVHLDTGRVHDKNSQDFDHHPENETVPPEFDSTAALLASDYTDELAEYPWLDDLIYASNLIDTGNQLVPRKASTNELRRELNESLRVSGEPELRVVDSLEQFRFMVNLFSNMIGPDYENLRAGLKLLFAWHESNRPKIERLELVENARVEVRNGVTVGILPETTISCDKIRNYLRVNRQYAWDVFLYCNAQEPRISITCLKKWVYQYMDRIFLALKEKYPYLNVPTELFLHTNRFMISIILPAGCYPEVVALTTEMLGTSEQTK